MGTGRTGRTGPQREASLIVDVGRHGERSVTLGGQEVLEGRQSCEHLAAFNQRHPLTARF